MPDIPQLADYARDATATISNARKRRAAHAELYANALDRYDDAIAAGLSHDAAVTATLAELGDPSAIRAALGKASRTRLSVRAIVAIVAAAIIVTILIIALIALWGAAQLVLYAN